MAHSISMHRNKEKNELIDYIWNKFHFNAASIAIYLEFGENERYLYVHLSATVYCLTFCCLLSAVRNELNSNSI